jgi:hemerythrin-like metal-binding protein
MNTNMSSVSASSEELSVSMKAIADSAKQSDENIEIITTGTKELSQASDEIARSTVRAAEISRKALENVVQATNLVSELEAAAREIGVVTSTISEISDQTKLLALNATIEAARAGEAGRGFAVVAKEVKDLASQTNTATRDIQRKVEVIQAATNRTITAIGAISQVMKEVDGVVTTIAAATEEQSATTRNISANVVDTTDRIKEMSGSVKEGASAVQEVNRSISGIAGLTDQVSRSIRSVSESNTAIRLEASVSYAHVIGVAGLGEEIRESLSGLILPPSLLAQGADTEPNLCRFTPRYKVSIEAMDADHGKIFEYINAVHRGIKNKLPVAELSRTTEDLALFTREHFDREERMMYSGGYPELAAQQKAHHALMAKMDGYLRGLKEGTAVDLINMMAFLKGWLQNHILGMDKHYGPFFNQKGVR